jgi:hypothetical protein
MLYAILCYNSEAEVGSWTHEREQAVLSRRALAQQKLIAKGKLGPVARLMPTTTATTVRMGREPLVVDGPFAETKEALLGFYVVECDSLEEVIATARDMLSESGSFEIRPLRSFKPNKLDLGLAANRA